MPRAFSTRVVVRGKTLTKGATTLIRTLYQYATAREYIPSMSSREQSRGELAMARP
jgi:hypothetical protein